MQKDGEEMQVSYTLQGWTLNFNWRDKNCKDKEFTGLFGTNSMRRTSVSAVHRFFFCFVLFFFSTCRKRVIELSRVKLYRNNL